MDGRWKRGTGNSDEAWQERKQLVNKSRPILDILKDILEYELKCLESKKLSEQEYDKPSWAYYQADLNGSKRVYQKILDLVSIKETK